MLEFVLLLMLMFLLMLMMFITNLVSIVTEYIYRINEDNQVPHNVDTALKSLCSIRTVHVIQYEVGLNNSIIL
jgi:hypothetical protein